VPLAVQRKQPNIVLWIACADLDGVAAIDKREIGIKRLWKLLPVRRPENGKVRDGIDEKTLGPYRALGSAKRAQ
jgi:hypothetical protein